MESGHVESSLLGVCAHSVSSFIQPILLFAVYSFFDYIASIEWFAPMFMDIANVAAVTSLEPHISAFVTCLCNPEAIPPIPNSSVIVIRPSIHTLLDDLLTPPSNSSKAASIDIEDDEGEKISESPKLNWVGLGGGVAVCASGPETLTREAHNAVARIGMMRGVELGGIALHTELFSL